MTLIGHEHLWKTECESVILRFTDQWKWYYGRLSKLHYVAVKTQPRVENFFFFSFLLFFQMKKFFIELWWRFHDAFPQNIHPKFLKTRHHWKTWIPIQGTKRSKCSPLPMGKNENGKLYFLLYRISDIADVLSTYFLVFVIFFELSQLLILTYFTLIFNGYYYNFFYSNRCELRVFDESK